MLQLFEAPPLVRHALNNICNLETTYVMSSDDLATAKSMMQQHNRVRTVFTPKVSQWMGAEGTGCVYSVVYRVLVAAKACIAKHRQRAVQQQARVRPPDVITVFTSKVNLSGWLAGWAWERW